MREYYLNNNNMYRVTNEKEHFKVEEFRPMFDGSFYSSTGYVIMLDNFAEVREVLTELNGGIEVYG